MSKLRQTLLRLKAATEGLAAVEFAVLAPVMLGLGFGIVDMGLLVFEYHRAGDAARRATRTATIVSSVPDLSALTAGTPITCTSSGSVVDCGGTAVNSAASFTSIVGAMQALLPQVTPQNVEIEYRLSGIGDAATPAGVLPFVTVRLVNLDYNFMMIDAFPGMPSSVTLPTFEVTQLARSVN